MNDEGQWIMHEQVRKITAEDSAGQIGCKRSFCGFMQMTEPSRIRRTDKRKPPHLSQSRDRRTSQSAARQRQGKSVSSTPGPSTALEIQSHPAEVIPSKYEIILYWSNEDEVFIAEVPELPGCIAHGLTQESALANAKEAIQLWLDTAQEFGDSIPEPKGRRLMLA